MFVYCKLISLLLFFLVILKEEQKVEITKDTVTRPPLYEKKTPLKKCVHVYPISKNKIHHYFWKANESIRDLGKGRRVSRDDGGKKKDRNHEWLPW